MVRAVLLGLLIGASVASCKGGGSDAPAVQSGVKAGVVVEITGRVTATRAGALRELTVGGEVSGDDVVTTPADGSVAIELVHNNARWNLGGGKTGRVSASVAWGLPKAAHVAGAVDQDTSAAGRHAERNAADTAASTTETVATPTMAPTPTMPTTPEPTALKPTRTQKPPPKPRVAAPLAPAATPQRETMVAPPPKTVAAPRNVQPPPPPPHEAPVATGSVDDAVPRGPTPTASAKATVVSDRELRACLGTVATAHVVITCDGACKITSATNVDATGRKCLDARLGKLRLATGKYTIVVDLAK